MENRLKISVFMLIISMFFVVFENRAQQVSNTDSWAVTDGLGRRLPSYEECGPLKKDKYVGIFYFITHNNPSAKGPFDVSKIMKENPAQPKWGNGSHFWGEPEDGYYLSYDNWVIKKHARLLADAGVDVIIIDVTNDITYRDTYLNICKAFSELRALGETTPSIAFLGSEISVNKLWEEFYQKGLYKDLWFMWKEKPLLLFGQHEVPSRKKNNDVVFSKTIQEFFSIRQSWAWTTLPWYQSAEWGKDKWPWIDHFPQAVGWHETPKRAEMVPVGVAQHPLSNIGRSFHNFSQPTTNQFDLTPFTNQGLYFEEQWRRALKVSPEFIFITGWNEWSAGAQVMGPNISQSLQKWAFYPGAHLGKAGKPLKTGDYYFIDQYNQEFSRDIEPMKGGHADNYYYQLMANIRKYKGMSSLPTPNEKHKIDISGSFSQWENVSKTYPDHVGDIDHRNSLGQGELAGTYRNTTGRNDIRMAKVTYDDSSIYFYVETVEPLTSITGKNWMLLFIDSDKNKSTGWNGYDFVINASISGQKTTTISALSKLETLQKPIPISYKTENNQLMIAVKKTIIKQNSNTSFEFHWADNIQKLGDITEFFSNGDHAPERRANYQFQAN